MFAEIGYWILCGIVFIIGCHAAWQMIKLKEELKQLKTFLNNNKKEN